MSKFSRKSTIRGLITTRKVGEQIVVNNGEIIIEVVDIQGKAVRLCFQAHKEIKIERIEAPIEPKPKEN